MEKTTSNNRGEFVKSAIAQEKIKDPNTPIRHYILVTLLLQGVLPSLPCVSVTDHPHKSADKPNLKYMGTQNSGGHLVQTHAQSRADFKDRSGADMHH